MPLIERPRRLRQNPILRKMLQDVQVMPEHLVYPLFVKEGVAEKIPIPAMPGQFQWSLNELVAEARDCWEKGVRAIILFGIPQHKDEKASSAYALDGIVQQALRAIKKTCPDLLVITDVCLCAYMDHGHCGVLRQSTADSRLSTAVNIDNDASLELLAKTAVSHALAGADMVAPSDMMDGRVGAIRGALDESGFNFIPIMSYAVKYASNFYSPFRDAAESKPKFGDRKTYQMDFARAQDAVREALLDEKEGADILLVKPALPYLDILKTLAAKTTLPLAAYQVSGEYSMICAAAEKGWIDREQVILESLTAIKRAGAQLIITYFAKESMQYFTAGR